jgi:hypothetical protein
MMGQGDVLDVLKMDKNKWWSLRELQEELSHISKGSVCVSAKKLKEANMVKHELRELRIPLNGGKSRKHMTFMKWRD